MLRRLPRLRGARAAARGLLVAAMAGGLAPLAAAEPADAARWLQKVSEAANGLNYEGVFVYQHRGGLEAMRIVHRVGADGARERLFALTGTPREIIRDDEKVTCILPDNRAVLIDRRQASNPLTELVPRDVDSLSANYELSVVGDGRVADRPAKRIAISPRDEYRYGYQLWIDQASGLLLRAEVSDDRGQSIEQLMFAELSTPESIPESLLEPQLSGTGITWDNPEPPAGEAAGKLPWKANGLPSGFELVLHEASPLPGSAGAVEHLLFSDGLANVSVYIERTALEDAFTGQSHMGAVNAFGRTVDGMQITAVGEVPAVTVQRIAEAIEPGR